MNRDDIIRMAREAGMPPVEIISDKPVLYPVPDAIERFAALVAAAGANAALEAAARQALGLIWNARLCEVNSMSSRQEMLRLLIEAADTLRAALKEQE